ncbi:MAG: DUF3617 family protein [Nitrospirae bacterium]|nr:DUF3617 family protein [Nitrospirota bacterium]
MGKTVCISLIAVSLFLLWGITFAGGPNLKEGLWEITVKMDVSGMNMQMPPQKFTQCIRKDNMIPQQEPDEKCKIIKTDVKGDTVSWVIECKGPEGTTKGNGSVTYKGDTFEGFMKVKQADMEITQHMSGRLIGQCK